jgi:hypothetical protein
MEINKYIEKQQNKKSIFYKKDDKDFIRIIAFNMQYKGKIDEEQIEQLNKLDADIMCLSECFKTISTQFKNFDCIVVNDSHTYGKTKLFINKRLKPEIINIEKDSHQFALAIINTTHGKLLCGSMHFTPGKIQKEIGYNIQRTFAMQDINDYVNKYNYPVIIGGDTNMSDYENELFNTNYDLLDAWEKKSKQKYYLTWPNREYNDNYYKVKTTDIKGNFRFDRFFTKNCEFKRFRTINTKNSDHLMIVMDVVLPIIHNKIDTPIVHMENSLVSNYDGFVIHLEPSLVSDDDSYDSYDSCNDNGDNGVEAHFDCSKCSMGCMIVYRSFRRIPNEIKCDKCCQMMKMVKYDIPGCRD